MSHAIYRVGSEISARQRADFRSDGVRSYRSRSGLRTSITAKVAKNAKISRVPDHTTKALAQGHHVDVDRQAELEGTRTGTCLRNQAKLHELPGRFLGVLGILAVHPSGLG